MGSKLQRGRCSKPAAPQDPRARAAVAGSLNGAPPFSCTPCPLLSTAQNLIAGTGLGISDELISLEVSSPSVPDLTLIDLPGITRVAVGNQPTDIGRQVRLQPPPACAPDEGALHECSRESRSWLKGACGGEWQWRASVTIPSGRRRPCRQAALSFLPVGAQPALL